MISFHQQLFALTSRSILRTQWKIEFEQALRSLPRKRIHSHRSGAIRRISLDLATIVEHPSLLIRAIAGTSDYPLTTFRDGVDVFVDLYLKEFPESGDVDFGVRDGIKEAMERYRKWDATEDLDEDSESGLTENRDGNN